MVWYNFFVKLVLPFHFLVYREKILFTFSRHIEVHPDVIVKVFEINYSISCWVLLVDS